MEKYLFLGKVLPFFEHQDSIRKVYAYSLRVLAVLTFFAGTNGLVELWRIISRLSAQQVPGGVIFTLLYVVAIYMAIHLLWVRSYSFLQLPDAEFSFTHSVELLVRVAGELYFVYTVPLAIGGGFFIWFAGNEADSILAKLIPLAHPGSYGITGGFLYLVSTLFLSIVVFTASRLIVDFLVMLVELTMNVRFLRNQAEKK